MSYQPLRLKKHEERRLRLGHPWVFSNEVDIKATPIKDLTPGAPVIVEAANGKAIGVGYANPHTLICARLVARDATLLLDKSLIVHRLNVALSLRERLFPAPYYRLVFGESDGLPGLVVDRFGDYLVAQIATAGMERLKADIVQALTQVLRPRGILWRNDVGARELEQLPRYVEVAAGEVPRALRVEEHGAQFEIDPYEGQKTGWFFDQARNRARVADYVRGARVLDVFSYVGAWAIPAARAGAASVLAIDASAKALEALKANAERNGVDDKIEVRVEDAFDALSALRGAHEKFDVVLLDPPAFIKRKKDLDAGTEAYRRINQLAMQLVAKDGYLVTSSCSYHFAADDFADVLLQTSRHLDRQAQFIELGQQAPDHPVHPALAETRYLKTFFMRLLWT